jgi:di/tricarboxylate transporter
MPGINALLAIALALFAIFLYTRERFSLAASSFALIGIVAIWVEWSTIELNGQRIDTADIFAGFGNQALITITALLILARGLETTRALQPIGQVLARLWLIKPMIAFLATMVTVAILSMFLNNTPVVAAMLPLLVAVTLQAKQPASPFLMPIGFATIIGGMATTIGTSTNLLVTSVAADLGMREFGMFEFAGPVVIVGGVGILYLWLVAPGLLPARKPPLADVAPRVFESRLRINDGGAAHDRTLSDARALTGNRMRVEKIERDGLQLMRLPSVALRDGDLLHVRDTPENLKEFERLLGATLLTGDTTYPVSPDHPLASDQHLAEAVVTEGSPLEQRTIDANHLLSTYGVIPLALHRPGKEERELPDAIETTVLRAGDIVLLQGPNEGIQRLKRRGPFLLLDGKIDLPRPARASVALAIMAAVVTVAAIGLMPISLAAVGGVGLMLVTRCLSWKDLRGAIDGRIILVIVASLALGLMLMATGAADYIARLYVAMAGDLPVPIILSGLLLIMALLTEVVTNNAIAVLGTPIAISIAAQLGVSPEPFVLAVLYGANMSYLTPVGYQTNLLVMSAGGYRFTDFWRAGLPLQLIMWLGLSFVLPMFYEL